MAREINQYAVYRLKRDRKETRPFRRQTSLYLQEHDLKVNSDYYRQILLAGFDPPLEPAEIRDLAEKALPADNSGETLEVSDVLAVTRDGITTAFYVDPEALVPLAGFFHTRSVTKVSGDTTDYKIEGMTGKWFTADDTWIDGLPFFLMENQQYGPDAAYVVLDHHGTVITTVAGDGFNDETVAKIREYLQKKDRQNDGNSSTDSAENTETIARQENEPHTEDPAHDDLPQMPEKPPAQQTSSESASTSAQSRPAPSTASNINRQPKHGKKRKGTIPLKARKSLLDRLARYKDIVARQHGQPGTA